MPKDRWKSPADMTLAEIEYVLARGWFRSYCDSVRAYYCSPAMTVTAWLTLISLFWLVLSLLVA